ncbi:efflux RND transporter permease subunit [Arsenicibacter rosenii]|uniref:Acriflavin resistance protein n=1 Tax=Arsenicibacter rosenii TaxID=1750698 RepID=A0A1S2VMQ8_9BACT|nr:efflux RND transporter permease subunit [Arsenicibacter rosenii]OIN59485.1 acriflavin resistance protein [Arsenicibacter rosenii]
MTRYLLHRPIAVCTVTLVLVVLGILALRQLPVSLLPDIPIPEITVQVSYPAASARELQRSIELPLRNQLLQVNHLDDIQSAVQDGQATITLRFDYGTNIRLAYLETNEKIDALLSRLPRDLERPKVIRAGAGDLPVFTLNVWPKAGKPQDFPALSDFCENVLKRRIEQLTDVALVDATGLAQPEAVVQADPGKLAALGLTDRQLADLLKQANLQPGNFTVREGPYQYSVRFGSVLQTRQDIENLYIPVGGTAGGSNAALTDPRVSYFADNVQQSGNAQTAAPRRLLALRDVATVSIREQPQKGVYVFNGQRTVGMAIIKQSDAQLLHLRRELDKLLRQFQTDYPDMSFALSQDQTELLDLSISNLVSNLLTGALLTFVMVFFFLRDRRLPLLIGLVLPVSLAVTFLGFYGLGLSINIVSLAGLVLGVGEIIDSAIIIIETIEESREAGASIEEACVTGTEEVIRPLFTSVLTNSAVFLPLLLLSGLAGALFFDQAVSVSLALGVSLLCSYTLVPVLYYLMYRNRRAHPERQGIAVPDEEARQLSFSQETRVMRWLAAAYNFLFRAAFRFKGSLLACMVLLLAGAVWMSGQIGKQGMPAVSRTESEVAIDWNEPLTVAENQRRVTTLLGLLKTRPDYVSAFIGQQQFVINRMGLQQTENETLLSIQLPSVQAYETLNHEIAQTMRRLYPDAVCRIKPAANVFEQLFTTNEPAARLKLYNTRSAEAIPADDAERIRRTMGQGRGVGYRQRLTVRLLPDRLLLYDVDDEVVIQALKTAFNNNQVTTLLYDQRQLPLVLSGSGPVDWQTAFVNNRQKQPVPLRQLIDITPTVDYKTLFADKEGVFVPIDFDALPTLKLPDEPNVLMVWSGRYVRDRQYLTELGWIVCIAIALLFCILTAQFESLQQPLIVMLTIMLGLAGAVWALYLADDSLNVMSAIGMVVLIGLLDNDSILKIDTMNKGRAAHGLMEAIRLAGLRRLKSQMMTFLTTVLGLLPVLFSGGLGAELQRPLALSVIGGMCVGVLISWTVIPLLYWFLERRHGQ